MGRTGYKRRDTGENGSVSGSESLSICCSSQSLVRPIVRCRLMRSKGLLLVLLCLLATSVFYLLVGDPAAPSTDSLTAQAQSSPTPAQLRQVPFPVRHARVVTRDESQRLLQSLGFASTPRQYPADRWRNVSLPGLFVRRAARSGRTGRRFRPPLPEHVSRPLFNPAHCRTG